MHTRDLSGWEKAEYHRLRADGMGARHALAIAGRNHGGPDVPIEDNSTWESEGFTLRVRIHTDEYLTPEDVGLGKFTSRWEDGCLDRKKEGYHVGRNDHPYFLPDVTYAEHRVGGANHDEASRYVRSDLERAESYGSDWVYLSIQVTASRDGIELGSESLGATESDSGDRYLREIVQELAAEAIHHARESLERLCSCKED